MKKSLLGFTISALLVAGAAHATTNANDVSATLSVTGSVTKEFSCAVNVSKNTVDVSADINELVAQGVNALPKETIELTVTGDTDCLDMVKNNKIAYSFHGTADDVQGNVLANSLTDSSAAQGVGVGLYTFQGEVIELNKDTIPATNVQTQLGLSVVNLAGKTATAGSVQGALTIQIERL